MLNLQEIEPIILWGKARNILRKINSLASSQQTPHLSISQTKTVPILIIPALMLIIVPI